MNCYASYFYLNASDQHRVYLVSDEVFASWQATYPGNFSLGTAWPLVLGVCRDHLWQPMQDGWTWYI